MRRIALKAGSVPTDDIPKLLEDRGIHINRYAEMFFAHPCFDPVLAGDTTVTIASLQEIGFEDGSTLDGIFQRISEIGLKACPPCTGLLLRLAWMDQPQSQNSILSGTHASPDQAVTVLSEPLEQDDGFPKGLYLRNVDGDLWLRGYVCDAAYRFPSDSLFAFEAGSRAGQAVRGSAAE